MLDLLICCRRRRAISIVHTIHGDVDPVRCDEVVRSSIKVVDDRSPLTSFRLAPFDVKLMTFDGWLN